MSFMVSEPFHYIRHVFGRAYVSFLTIKQGELGWISRYHVMSFMVSEPFHYLRHVFGGADISFLTIKQGDLGWISRLPC